MSDKPGGRVFPQIDKLVKYVGRGGVEGYGNLESEKPGIEYAVESSGGLTLLDYFAGQALIGIVPEITNPERVLDEGITERELAVQRAFDFAEAMIKERERRPEGE